MNKLFNMISNVGYKVGNKVKRAVREERGASELVVLVGLIVITLAVIIIFRGQLTNIIKAVGTKVIDWINAN